MYRALVSRSLAYNQTNRITRAARGVVAIPGAGFQIGPVLISSRSVCIQPSLPCLNDSYLTRQQFQQRSELERTQMK